MTEEPPWKRDPDVRERLERNGRSAAIFGILAMTLAMAMVCTYYVTLLPAIACGGVAVWLGRQVVLAGVEGEARAYAKVGIWSGALASGFSALLMLLCGLVIVVYVGFIGFIGVLAALSGG